MIIRVNQSASWFYSVKYAGRALLAQGLLLTCYPPLEINTR